VRRLAKNDARRCKECDDGGFSHVARFAARRAVYASKSDRIFCVVPSSDGDIIRVTWQLRRCWENLRLVQLFRKKLTWIRNDFDSCAQAGSRCSGNEGFDFALPVEREHKVARSKHKSANIASSLSFEIFEKWNTSHNQVVVGEDKYESNNIYIF